MSKKNLKIRLSHNKWLHAISSTVFLLEEPALSERLGVDQSRAVLHLLVLGSDGARDRAVDLAGRLDGLHGAALLAHLQAGAGLGELGVDHVPQGVRRVLGHSDGSYRGKLLLVHSQETFQTLFRDGLYSFFYILSA